MIEILEKHKPKITAKIQEIILDAKDEFGSINPWATETLDLIGSLAVRGKMVRGVLFLETLDAFNAESESWYTTVAASIELFHTGLLVHDDIMDNDYIRRGTKTLFAHFISVGEESNVRRAEHFGISQGISGGDVAFFLANKVLSEDKEIPSDVHKKLVAYFSKELILVGFAQMDDVYSGATSDQMSIERIIQTYRYKTARYTFSLPIEAACISAGIDTKTATHLSKIGEILGIIFQIKDDELGLFGTEEQAGKVIGSDIRERKQTLIYAKLIEHGEFSEIEKYFGVPVLSKAQVTFVQDHVKKTEALKDVESFVALLVKEFDSEIVRVADERVRKLLSDILKFNLSRYA